MTVSRHFAISESAAATNVTLCDENLRHYITDDELRRLGEMRKDLVMEICLASAGIFFGSVVPAWAGLSRFNNAPITATSIDLLSIVLCACAFVATGITGYQWYVRQKGHVDLETEIRSRPKVPVQLVRGEG